MAGFALSFDWIILFNFGFHGGQVTKKHVFTCYNCYVTLLIKSNKINEFFGCFRIRIQIYNILELT